MQDDDCLEMPDADFGRREERILKPPNAATREGNVANAARL